ncbi:CPCC family cysteine-rich protein [uncultured Ruminococcus sp.]|uniref:CPCC family cysteine-rich protein n=1 Tax=uncultured Ruminococcus sp. TaxID=165186 RepID=UPI0025DAB350|nr:CPCC family cysteine-rich protein [uncultured Ruminococcus sp.]
MKCPVCGRHEFKGYGDYDMCPVCGWENDGSQYDDHDYVGGANVLSVNAARIEFFLLSFPAVSDKAAELCEEHREKRAEVFKKYAGVDRMCDPVAASAEKRELGRLSKEYTDKLNELLMSMAEVPF